MSVFGRSQRCPCGSGNKARHCCDVALEASETELAEAFLAAEARQAACRLVRLSEEERLDLFDVMLDLPELHQCLQHQVDTPVERASLARDVLDLADRGEIDPAVADAALLDLDCRPTSALMRRSLLLTSGADGGSAGIAVAS